MSNPRHPKTKLHTAEDGSYTFKEKPMRISGTLRHSNRSFLHGLNHAMMEEPLESSNSESSLVSSGRSPNFSRK